MSLARRTILITLCLLVLMSSIGLSVGVHFCGGTLQDLALFHQADACPMEQKREPLSCHAPLQAAQDAESQDSDCCKDNLIVVDSMEDALAGKAQASLTAPDLQLMVMLQTTYQFLLLQADQISVASPPSYAAPPIVRDIPVFVQSFLI